MKIIIFLLTISLFACEDSTNTPKDTSPEKEGWKLVWNDEFDKTVIDPAKWEHEVNANGGGNNELQYYTGRLENSFVKNGKLNIVARYEEYSSTEGTRNFTSARLRTKYKGDWLYGRIEVSAKLPAGKGTWPAIWMLPTDWEYGGWPQSGEIDIMEHVGFDPNVIHGSIHTKDYNHIIGTQKTSSINVQTALSEFHIYAIEWTKDKIDFFVDDSLYFSFSNEHTGWEKWPFDKRFHLILNIAVGGSWGGQKGIDTKAFPATMEIDYVRVYERKD